MQSLRAKSKRHVDKHQGKGAHFLELAYGSPSGSGGHSLTKYFGHTFYAFLLWNHWAESFFTDLV